MTIAKCHPMYYDEETGAVWFWKQHCLHNRSAYRDCTQDNLHCDEESETSEEDFDCCDPEEWTTEIRDRIVNGLRSLGASPEQEGPAHNLFDPVEGL